MHTRCAFVAQLSVPYLPLFLFVKLPQALTLSVPGAVMCAIYKYLASRQTRPSLLVCQQKNPQELGYQINNNATAPPATHTMEYNIILRKTTLFNKALTNMICVFAAGKTRGNVNYANAFAIRYHATK